jgi:hypothetical protein
MGKKVKRLLMLFSRVIEIVFTIIESIKRFNKLKEIIFWFSLIEIYLLLGIFVIICLGFREC